MHGTYKWAPVYSFQICSLFHQAVHWQQRKQKNGQGTPHLAAQTSTIRCPNPQNKRSFGLNDTPRAPTRPHNSSSASNYIPSYHVPRDNIKVRLLALPQLRGGPGEGKANRAALLSYTLSLLCFASTASLCQQQARRRPWTWKGNGRRAHPPAQKRRERDSEEKQREWETDMRIEENGK